MDIADTPTAVALSREHAHSLSRPLCLLFVLATVGLLAAFGIAKHPTVTGARPSEAEAAAKAGDSAYAQGKFADSLRQYDLAVSLDPLVAHYRDLRGKARLQAGDIGGALTDFDGALSLTGQADPEAHYRRATWFFVFGDPRGALEELNLSLASDGGRPDSWAGRAQARAVLGDLDGARSDLEQALRLNREAGNDLAARGLEGQIAKSLAGTTPTAPADPEPPGVGDFAAGFALLRRYYVQAVSSRSVYLAAWTPILSAAQAKGVDTRGIRAPDLSDRDAHDTDSFIAAFKQLAIRGLGKVDPRALITTGLMAMAESLKDDHTTFVPPAFYQARRVGMSIDPGFTLGSVGANYYVAFLEPGSNVEKAGMQFGDEVLSIDGVGVKAWIDRKQSLTNAVLLVRHPDGGSATITLTGAPFTPATLTSHLLENDIGYLRLYRFPDLTEDLGGDKNIVVALDQAIGNLQKQGATRWILDLRNNHGGSITVTGVVLGRFGARGVVQRLAGREWERPQYAYGVERPALTPLVVLVNGSSYSASEVVADFFQSSGMAVVVGTQTMGLVGAASEYPLAGGAFEITQAIVYNGPAQHQLDGTGVTPDAQVLLGSGLPQGKDSQIERAIEILDVGRK